MADQKLEKLVEQSVESSFNESELEQIMSEIEDLEKDFSELPKSTKPDPIAEEMAESAEVTSESVMIEEPTPDPVADINGFDPIEQSPEEIVSEEVEVEASPVDELEQIIDEVHEEVSQEEQKLRISENDVVAKTKLQAQIDEEVNGLMAESDAPPTCYNNIEPIQPKPTTPEAVDEVIPLKPSAQPVESKSESAPLQSAMDFSIHGEISFKMNFNFGGKCVHMWVDAKDGFTIEMEDGMKFQVPLHKEKFKKAS